MRKKILITGASGLLGSHLVELLLQQEEIDIYVTARDKNNYSGNSKINVIQLDLAEDWDADLLPVDLYAIIHLAQAEKYRDFPASAKEVFYINTASTVRLADHAAKTKVSYFIYASSGSIYGSGGVFCEGDALSFKPGLGFYAGTKLSSELLLQAYSSVMNVISLRFFFIYGKGQRKDMLLPRLTSFVQNGQPISLEGQEGLQLNPVHASDAAKAVAAALTLSGSHSINVAGPETLSIKDIGEIISKELSLPVNFIVDGSKQSGMIIADIAEMKRSLIDPSVKFAEGVKTLI